MPPHQSLFTRHGWLCLVAALSALPTAQATSYTESFEGDMSNDRLAPTRLELNYDTSLNVVGSNVISGQVGRDTKGGIDRDYLNVIVPLGYVLSELRVGTQTTIGGSAGSFIGLAAGTSMPVLASATSASGLLGWKLYSPADATTDILDDMALAGNGASGFQRPLPANDYTFWIQELAPGKYNYRFNLILTPVPEPDAWWLSLIGAAAWLLFSVSKRRTPSPT